MQVPKGWLVGKGKGSRVLVPGEGSLCTGTARTNWIKFLVCW